MTKPVKICAPENEYQSYRTIWARPSIIEAVDKQTDLGDKVKSYRVRLRKEWYYVDKKSFKRAKMALGT